MSDTKCGPNVSQRGVKRVNHKKSRTVSEFRHWSFDETTELMSIWSDMDLDLFDTKSKCYKHIQRHLMTKGFGRSVEQIRCKLKRMTTFEAPKPQTTSATAGRHKSKHLKTTTTSAAICEPIEQQLSEDLKTDKLISNSIDYDIRLTDSESESEESLFGSNCASIMSWKTSSNDVKQRVFEDEDEDEDPRQKLLNGIQELKTNTEDCFNEIISGQRQIKDSIKFFNEELKRMTEEIVTNSDSNCGNSSDNEIDFDFKSIQKSIKFIIPNINNKYTIDLND